MFENAAVYNAALRKTLGDEVGEVDGGVYAYGCKCCAGVGEGGELGGGEDAEVWDYGAEPGRGGEEFVEPLACGCLGVFEAVVDYCFCLDVRRRCINWVELEEESDVLRHKMQCMVVKQVFERKI